MKKNIIQCLLKNREKHLENIELEEKNKQICVMGLMRNQLKRANKSLIF